MEANNAQAMRDALLKVKKLFDGRIMWQNEIREAHKAALAALAKPPRNCDVGTAEWQLFRHKEYCKRHTENAGCSKCPLVNSLDCRFAWANMPYDVESESK